MIFVYIWLGFGALSAIMVLVQWTFDGSSLHAESVNDEDGEQYYYLKMLAVDLGMAFVAGPITFFIQIANGMPVFPSRRK